IMPWTAAPTPLAPVRPTISRPVSGGALAVSTIEDVAASLRAAGEAGRRICVIGSARNVGTTYAAISVARALAEQASVVLVDFAFNAPNLSVISTDPLAPGLAELLDGRASFGEV